MTAFSPVTYDSILALWASQALVLAPSPAPVSVLHGMGPKLDQSLVGHFHKFCTFTSAHLAGGTNYSSMVSPVDGPVPLLGALMILEDDQFRLQIPFCRF